MARRVCGAVISLGLVAAMLATDNRAAMLALLAGVVVMAIGGRWRFAVSLVGAGAVAVVAILFWAQLSGTPWTRTPLHGFSQRVVSVVDFQGRGDYSSAEGAESKGDNNKFRAVWWKTVVDETVSANPWTGLGYGHDLAEAFLRAYYADSDDEFTARSPHNLLLSIFARTGAVGLGAFLILCVVMCGRTWRAARKEREEDGNMGGSPMPPDPHGRVARATQSHGLAARATQTEWQGEAWCFVWAIFVSACLGVVLEGPMGAVVFWVLLGAAAARSRAGADGADAGEGEASGPD